MEPALPATQSPIQLVPGFCAGGKAAGTWRSSSSTEVKNVWSYTSTPPIRFHGVDRDNVTFYSPFLTVRLVPDSWQTSCNLQLLTRTNPAHAGVRQDLVSGQSGQEKHILKRTPPPHPTKRWIYARTKQSKCELHLDPTKCTTFTI
jgi:hypothetical protein